MKLSIQLYTVSSEIRKRGLKAVIPELSALGYSGIETCFFHGFDDLDMNKTELAELFHSNNLYVVGNQFMRGDFCDSLDRHFETLAAIGAEYAFYCDGVFSCADDAYRQAEIMNNAAERAEKFGIRIGCHNHSEEFKVFNGVMVWDILAGNTTDKVGMEADVFFMKKMGVEPVELIKKWKNKIELLHIKQIDKSGNNVDIPDGILDMKAIVDAASKVRHIVLEQQTFDKPVMESVKINSEYLHKILD